MADNLDANATDQWSTAIRLATGLIPGAGPLLGEIFTQVIPRQRIDRVVEEIRLLAMRIEALELERPGAAEIFRRHASTERGAYVIEDAVIKAARVFEHESRERIAALVVRSLTEDELNHEQTQKLLNLFDALTYGEIITLIYQSLSPSLSDGPHETFRLNHADILDPVRERDDDASIALKAIRDGYRLNLVRLGLCSESERSGSSSLRVTPLGSLLARNISLPEET